MGTEVTQSDDANASGGVSWLMSWSQKWFYLAGVELVLLHLLLRIAYQPGKLRGVGAWQWRMQRSMAWQWASPPIETQKDLIEVDFLIYHGKSVTKAI